MNRRDPHWKIVDMKLEKIIWLFDRVDSFLKEKTCKI